MYTVKEKRRKQHNSINNALTHEQSTHTNPISTHMKLPEVVELDVPLKIINQSTRLAVAYCGPARDEPLTRCNDTQQPDGSLINGDQWGH